MLFILNKKKYFFFSCVEGMTSAVALSHHRAIPHIWVPTFFLTGEILPKIEIWK
jgi:hypothetical protein